jgi:hypothetical protein
VEHSVEIAKTSEEDSYFFSLAFGFVGADSLTAARGETAFAADFAESGVADFLAVAAFTWTGFDRVDFVEVNDFDEAFAAGALVGFAAAFDGDGFVATLA